MSLLAKQVENLEYQNKLLRHENSELRFKNGILLEQGNESALALRDREISRLRATLQAISDALRATND